MDTDLILFRLLRRVTIRTTLENKFHRNPSRNYGWMKEGVIETDRQSAGGVRWEKGKGSLDRTGISQEETN